jgi:circadian clock protein KaiB
MSSAPEAEEKTGRVCSVELYIAGDSANSRVARRNLELLAADLSAGLDVRVVDVSKDPQAAVEAGVFLTPALRLLSPGRGRLVFGDLSRRDELLALLECGGE